ncbi:hypothetical protein [Endozoicomonas ascidiicola]|uniref:hypothetical protein n=1 Tax=Endozoicomonas ascidiicola TaxID=1698521 RepID=UPI00082D31E3|nr:hypothetical protein [Endozoicomonas ascidiicola]
MDKKQFITEVEQRLTRLLSASKQGYPPTPLERHRLEGFMEAGVFIGLTSADELIALKETVCQTIFGMSIAKRIKQKSKSWPLEEIDYRRFEKPPASR